MARIWLVSLLTLAGATLWLPPEASGLVWPDPDWVTATPESQGLDRAVLDQARDYALTGGGSGYVVYRGYLVYEWGNPDFLYQARSTTKSIGATTLGLAMGDGLLDLSDPADLAHPDFANPPDSNALTGWPPLVNLLQLAIHSAGFEKDPGYGKMEFEPGTAWNYSNGGANWLAEIVTLAHGLDLNAVLQDRILTPLDVSANDLIWRANISRPDQIEGIKNREFGSGIKTNVDVMARIGLLHLREGKWKSQQLLPQAFIDRVRSPAPELAGLAPTQPTNFPDATDHYGLLWWNNADGTLPEVPTDAYWSWGLGENLIVVMPSKRLVVARAGNGWGPVWNADYTKLDPFLTPLAQAVPLPIPALRGGAAALLALTLLAVGLLWVGQRVVRSRQIATSRQRAGF